MKRDIQKKKYQVIKVVNTTFYDTYPLYKYNIGIDYNQIRNRMKRDIQKRESQVIKVVNVILDLMTLTDYASTIYVCISSQ